MNTGRRRPLSLTNLRAFEAVARRLSFSDAADELFVTQSAISRQIKSAGRRTRRGRCSCAARAMWRSRRTAQILLRTVRALAGAARRRRAPDPRETQPAACQRHHLRVVRVAVAAAAHRGVPAPAPRHRHPRLGARLAGRPRRPRARPGAALLQPGAGAGRRAAPVRRDAHAGGEPPADGRRSATARRRRWRGRPTWPQHTLAEEDDNKASTEYLSWRHWLAQHGEPALQPRRWLYLNFTYQQVQAALAGQGVALARVALVFEALAARRTGRALRRGRPHQPARTPTGWSSPPASRARPEVQQFCDWVAGSRPR